MRKVFLVAVLLTVLITVVAWAEDTASAAAGGVCNGATFAAQLRAQTVEDLDEIQTIEPAAPSEMGGVHLNCPTTSNCVGGANKCSANPVNCAATGSINTIHFGSRACELPNGSLFKCKGIRTVHLVITQCEQCECCSTIPTCLCPLDCGEARTLACL